MVYKGISNYQILFMPFTPSPNTVARRQCDRDHVVKSMALAHVLREISYTTGQ